MTAYSAGGFHSGDQVSQTRQVAVRAGEFELKIVRIEVVPTGQLDPTAPYGLGTTMFRYSGANISGGSVVTPPALRQGGPAASATARMGTVSTSGTSTRLGYFWTPLLVQGSYDFPFDLTVSVGSAFVVQTVGAGITGTMTGAQVNVYFEELRLSWHY